MLEGVLKKQTNNENDQWAVEWILSLCSLCEKHCLIFQTVIFLISCLAVAKGFSVLSLVQHIGVSLLKRRRHFFSYEHINIFIVIVYILFIVLCILYIYKIHWPKWNLRQSEFHSARSHVNADNEVTSHHSEILSWSEISNRFEFTSGLM